MKEKSLIIHGKQCALEWACTKERGMYCLKKAFDFEIKDKKDRDSEKDAKKMGMGWNFAKRVCFVGWNWTLPVNQKATTVTCPPPPLVDTTRLKPFNVLIRRPLR